MSVKESSGWSLKVVSFWTLSLMSYLLWGGAAAIHQGYQDQAAAALEVPEEEAAENESDGYVGPRRVRGVNGIVAVVVVTIAALWKFVVTSFVQIAHFPQLVVYMLRERSGYLIFSAVVLIATGLGLFWLGSVRQSLETRNPFVRKGRKRKKLPGIRTPQPLDD